MAAEHLAWEAGERGGDKGTAHVPLTNPWGCAGTLAQRL